MTALKSKSARKRKKMFLVEDHSTFRQGLIQILNREKQLTVCGATWIVDQAHLAITRTKPDLVLVHTRLPGRSVLDLIKKVRSANRTIKLLVISTQNEPRNAARVLRVGADGYIVNQEDSEEIVQAIYDVLEGYIYVGEEVMESTRGKGPRRLSNEKARLLDHPTDTELEILELLGRGKSRRGVARQLRFRERSFTVLTRNLVKN
jgi:DNA-binding NarL/FixJ family response regulator